VDDGDLVPHRGVVQEVAGREVVGSVDDHIPALAEDPVDVLGGQALVEDLDRHVGVQRLDGALGRLCLRVAEAFLGMDGLALEVRLVDDVVVHDPQRADPGGRQVERRG
jgi:hypothetical protein